MTISFCSLPEKLTGVTMPQDLVLHYMNWATPLTWPTLLQVSWLEGLMTSTECSQFRGQRSAGKVQKGAENQAAAEKVFQKQPQTKKMANLYVATILNIKNQNT